MFVAVAFVSQFRIREENTLQIGQNNKTKDSPVWKLKSFPMKTFDLVIVLR